MITPVKQWRRQKQIASQIGKKGKILLWTIIRIPSKAFMNQAPFPVVIVLLNNGEKMVGQLVDFEQKHLQKDVEVIVVLRKNFLENNTGIIPYSLKFKPIHAQ